MVLSVSITSKCLSMAVLAVSVMAISGPIASTGPATTAAVAKNATSAPTVSVPLATEKTPTISPVPSASSGSSVTTREKTASDLALKISVCRSSSACSLKASSASLLRPNALSTRMPCTDSSTVVARSPAWSWLLRLTRP